MTGFAALIGELLWIILFGVDAMLRSSREIELSWSNRLN
jgi:hypothetical protein